MTFADSELSRHTAQLVDLVAAVVQPTGFDAAQWVADPPWPCRVARLVDVLRADLMDTTDGRAMVLRLVRLMQSGA
jgi:hypothetical protein